jgi:hypothetical protein
VKEVILMRRVNFEGRVANVVGYLKEAVQRMSLRSLPHITYLSYDYNEGEDAWLAMREALLAHTA